MAKLYTRGDLIELLRRSHAELETVTERHGCQFLTAVVLVDCENALQNHRASVDKVPAVDPVAVHVH